MLWLIIRRSFAATYCRVNDARFLVLGLCQWSGYEKFSAPPSESDASPHAIAAGDAQNLAALSHPSGLIVR